MLKVKRVLNIFLVFILLFFSALKGKCQDIIAGKDFELWNNYSLSKNIGKKFELNLAEEFRFINNASSLDKFFTESSAEYNILSYLKIGAEFRFYRHKKNKGGIEYQKRLRGMLTYEYKLKRFKLNYKLSFQVKDENVWLNHQPYTSGKYNLRNKISIKYDVPNSKIDSKLSAEIFRLYQKDIVTEYNKYRVTAGINYHIIKSTKLEIFYRFEKELNTSQPFVSHILGAGLNYRL